MPVPRRILNAFTVQEVHQITGLSRPMIDYLLRADYLRPSHVDWGTRGKVRYYSYRDLVVARLVQRLRESGVELARVKDALKELAQDSTWTELEELTEGTPPIHWLVSDGKRVYVQTNDGFLEEMGHGRQRSFAFVVSLGNMREEVRKRIPRKKRRRYTMINEELIEDTATTRLRSASRKVGV